MIETHTVTTYVVMCQLCTATSVPLTDGWSTPEAAYDDALANGWSLDVFNGINYDLCHDCQ